MEPSYWRWSPDLPDGVYDSPHFGELVPGRVVAVPARLSHLVANNQEWSKATVKQFESQRPIHVEREARRRPHSEEE